MQSHRTGIGALVLILAAGCVPSLHPLYTEQDVIFDSKLVGLWSNDSSKDKWEFSKPDEDEKSYRLVASEGDGKSGTFDAHLLRVDGKFFLDLFPQDPELKQSDFFKSHLVPCHTFVYVKQIEPTLEFQFPSYDWLYKFIEENPRAIRHEKINERQLILTASTREMQSFWIKHLDTKDAFGEPTVFLKRKPKAAPINNPDSGSEM